jgi:hypothetical protein
MQELESLEQISSESRWPIIGGVLTELEKRGSVDSQGVPWAQHVLNRLESIGRPIAAQQLRKIRRCYLFIKETAKLDPFLYSDCPLSGIEVISKIFAIDQEEGRKQLEIINSGLPYTDILRVYEGLKASVGPSALQSETVGPRHRSHPRERQTIVEKEVRDWIENKPTVFFGEDVKRVIGGDRKPKSKYQQANLIFRFVVAGADTVNRYAAFEIKQIGMVAARNRQMVVTEISVTASFYDIFWLILADVQDGQEIAAGLDYLGLQNVGLALLTADGKQEIVRNISGLPFPDRRRLLVF